MEIAGTIIKKFDTERLTDRFQKRDFLLRVYEDKDYPQKILFTLTNAHCEKLDKFKENDKVIIQFNILGRQRHVKDSRDKYFNTLECWHIQSVEDRQRFRDAYYEHEQD